MNAPDRHAELAQLATPEKFAELLARTREPFPASRKAHLPGHLHTDLRVPVRDIALTNGEVVSVYDTSGPYTDPEAAIDVRQGLASVRGGWITGPAARRDGHRWRARACAILTGIGTVREDDPLLSVRDVPCTRQPLRILVDARLEVSAQARILQGEPILIATASIDEARIDALRAAGHELVCVPNAAGKVELGALLRVLGERGLNEVHVEAGFKLNGSLMREGCVDELLIYLAPMLVGDAAQGLFNLPALTRLEGATRLDIRDLRRIGADLRLIARPLPKG